MRNNYHFILICLCIGYCIPNKLVGQVQLSDFKRPVEQAVIHSKELQNALLENQKVTLEREEVKGKFLPIVSLNGGYGYLNSSVSLDLPAHQLSITGINLFEGLQRSNLSTQVAVAGFTAKQIIFSGLQITNGQRALEQKFNAQALMREAGKDQIAKEVMATFDQLMLLREVDLLIQDSERRLTKEHLKVVKAIENGLAIPYDRDKIKLAMLELESKAAELESNRQLLYFKLQELTGLEHDELGAVIYPLSEMAVVMDEATVMNRKEVQALEVSQEAYRYLLKKEQGAKLPMVFAFGNMSYLNAFDSRFTLKDLPQLGDVRMKVNQLQFAPNYAVGVGVKWNIFEGKSHKAGIEKAKLDLQINANKLEDTREKLSLLQRKARADYELSLKKIKVNQQQVAIAKNNLHLATRQFEEGLSDVTERLEAENEFYKQSLNYYSQVLNQRNAVAELLKANGNLYEMITR